MSRPLHGWSTFGFNLVLLGVLLGAFAALAAGAGVTIPEGDLSPLSAPCQLTVTESPTTRVLTWSQVAGATSYKVGFIRGSEIVGLAETSNTTYTHSGFDPGSCLQYVVVAYDGSGRKVCAAAAQVGKCP
jgi:hypothetical protein